MPDTNTNTKAPTSLRSNIFSRSKAKSKIVDFFGEKVELRQPSMRNLFNLQMEEENLSRRAAIMIVNYSYIPGTDEKVFDPADVDSIQDLPFGADMKRLQDAISELTGTGDEAVASAEKNSEQTSTD